LNPSPEANTVKDKANTFKLSRRVQLGLLALVMAVWGVWAWRAPTSTPPASTVAPVASSALKGAPVAPPVAASTGQPAWKDLNAEQRLALAPLQGVWAELATDSKRKWMLMSKNFTQMSTDEQGKLQSRMKAWAALPRNERIEARQNFVATQNISSELKSQQWEAYQQLSPEEKQKLAAKAPAVRVQPGVAVSKPSQGDKLADVPVIQHPYEQASEPGFKLAVPSQALDRKTLLPTSAQASDGASTSSN
jgi:hypothetical protein